MISLFITVFNNKFGILYSFYSNLYLKDVINIGMFRNYFDQLLKDFSLFFKFKSLLAETLLVDLSRFYLTINCLKKNLFMVLLLKSLVFDDVCVYRLGTGK
jgi:hypothetical protein